MNGAIKNDTAGEETAANEISRIAIVDDDESVREAIKSLLNSVGLNAEVFASANDFLDSERVEQTGCLILDLSMPGMSGLELQDRLVSSAYKIPIIFITAHTSDSEARNRALQAGALDFLSKPFNEETLLGHVYSALGLRRSDEF